MITATDLDLIFIHQINNVEIIEDGKTTTSSSTMHDIRKLKSGKRLTLLFQIKVDCEVESENSVFNLNCISASNFL